MSALPSLLVLGSLALLVAAGPAAADVAVTQLPTGCTGTGIGDHDSDGVPETSGTCQTPPCGCNCPVVGAGVDLVARGQEVDAKLLAGCGYYLVYDIDPNDVDWDGPVSVVPTVYCYSGGAPEFCRLEFISWG